MTHDHEKAPCPCPIYRICETLSKKWIIHILRALTDGGTLRFTEIISAVPEINSRMLSERLSELEQEGMVRRTVQDTKPIIVSYQMTEKGRDLQKIFTVFHDWERKWGKGKA